MKDGWKIARIGEICNVKTGKLDANAACENGKYPFFTCSKETLRINTYSYDLECLLIAGNGDLNVKYYKGKFDAYQRTYIVSLKNNTLEISTYYLYMFFSKYIEVLRNRSIGGVIKYIKLGDITNAKVLIPSYEEQSRIVEELDQLSNIIEKKRQQLSELDNLAQSIFYDMFGDPVANEKGWEVKKLGEVTSFKNGVNYQKVDDGIEHYFLSVSDFKDNTKLSKISDFSTVFINDHIDEEYLLKDNDIVFVRSNGSKNLVGRNVIIYTNGENITYSGFCIRCRIVCEMLIPIYVNSLLSSFSIKQQIKNFGRGANISNLNQTMLGAITVILPPLHLQQLFAQKIEAIEKEKELIKQSIKETEELFNSRMDYYFG